MADVKFRVVTATLNTSPGNQDITISGFGTPSAAIVFYGGDSSGTQKANATLGVGFTDGTNECCVAISSEDAVTTTDTYRKMRNDRFIDCLSGTTSASDYVASFSAWITDGIRINIASAPSGTRTATFILIGGADVTNATVGDVPLGFGTSAITETIGHSSDLILSASSGHDISTSAIVHSILSLGMYHNDGADTQKSVCFLDQDDISTPTPSDVGGYFSTTNSALQVFNGTATWVAQISNVTSTTFDVTPSASASGDDLIYLALKFSNSPDISIDTLDGPTATGSYSTTAPGFEPDFCLMFLSDNTTVNTVQNSESISISAFDAANEACLSYSSKDNVTFKVAKSEYNASAVADLTAGNTDLHVGTFTSFDANGFTLNFPSTVAGTSRKWAALTIGPAIASETYTTFEDSSQATDGAYLGLLL